MSRPGIAKRCSCWTYGHCEGLSSLGARRNRHRATHGRCTAMVQWCSIGRCAIYTLGYDLLIYAHLQSYVRYCCACDGAGAITVVACSNGLGALLTSRAISGHPSQANVVSVSCTASSLFGESLDSWIKVARLTAYTVPRRRPPRTSWKGRARGEGGGSIFSLTQIGFVSWFQEGK